jgi:IS5 family transposase
MPRRVDWSKGACAMSQISFVDAEYADKRKKTRREVFLEEMELLVPWKVLLKIIEP